MPTAATGLLLAAGEGRRIGTPKALLCDTAGRTFLATAVDSLRNGGCERVVVVLGAAAEEATASLEADEVTLKVVVAGGWAEGMGASLRHGLAVLLDGTASSALVTLVDLPDVGAAVVRRVRERLGEGPAALGRASYDGVPGHPVLLGRDHWPGVIATARGDQGARAYFETHEPDLVECGDLATGRDVDTTDDLPP